MHPLFCSLLAPELSPRLYSMRGVPDAPWIVVLSSVAIACAHLAIILVMLLVIFKRKDGVFRFPALLFAFYIGYRGLTQLLLIRTVWSPQYQLSGWMRGGMTVLSVATAVTLFCILPALQRLPSNEQLEALTEERRQVEDSARERAERFRNFVDHVQDYAMIMLDPRGFVESWNRGAERIKGYTAEEIIGKHFSLFYTPEDQGKNLPESTLAFAREHGGHSDEGWRVRKDGSRFWARVATQSVTDASGQLCGFSKISRDLTGPRELEAKYRLLLEATPDAMIMVNRQGKIQFVNLQTEKLFGYSPAELMGRSVDILVPERFRGNHGNYRHGFFNAPHGRQMGAGRELSGLRKDGSEFQVEISLSPIETKEGPVALAAVRDVTERKKAETRFRGLLDSAPDAMVIVNSDGFIELANKQSEKLFGYSQMQLVGQSVDVLIPAANQNDHGKHLKHFFSNPRSREMGPGLSLEAVRKDGSLFPVEISLSPLEGPDGISVTAAIRDVTKQKFAAQQLAENVAELRQSNEALEQFAHIASHDLQEPLRMVASYTQLLAKRYKGRLDADADEFIEFAVDGTRRMKALIQDLLLYSRAGRGALPPEQVSSDLCLQKALNNLFTAIQESQAQITYGDLPIVTAIDSQLVQVFQNLVGNALKYRGQLVPEIQVSAVLLDREWVFSVKDNGIGIDPKYFERVFEIFQRLHGREEYDGTGIGLAICKRILQQQGGRIWVESEPGCGSDFRFTLPMR